MYFLNHHKLKQDWMLHYGQLLIHASHQSLEVFIKLAVANDWVALDVQMSIVRAIMLL